MHLPARPITPEIVLLAYTRGAFPMAPPQKDQVEWFTCDPRAVVPLDARFHVPGSLRRTIRKGLFELRTDTAFGEVIRACAHDRAGSNRSWISPTIIRVYEQLHRMGFAHSVEAWRSGTLVGGLYGVALGGAFFGESMFCRPQLGGTDASKVCLVALVERLRRGGYVLCDSQYANDHMRQFGVYELPAKSYLQLLEDALEVEARWVP
ncbi:MAG: leucyl/phenylalanyl-tRNA--protein transferase [Phycisphaerales bacterium]